MAAGDPDTTFGTAGRTTADFPGDFQQFAEDVAVQADGKTVVAGFVQRNISGSPLVQHFALARFNLDGTLDRTFGANQNGMIIQPIGGNDIARANAVEIMPDGRIVVVGTAKVARSLEEDFQEFAVARFLPNGQLDNSFDDDGLAVVEFSRTAEATDVALRDDGRLIVVGFHEGQVTFTTRFFARFAVVGLRTDGSLDRTFGTLRRGFGGGTSRTGKLDLDLDGKNGSREFARAVQIDNRGNASTNPNFGNIFIGGSRQTSLTRSAVARLRSNGDLDTTFNSDGVAYLDAPGGASFSTNDMLIQADGKLLIAGTAGESEQVCTARYTTDGSVDTTFNGDGFAVTDLGGEDRGTALTRSGNTHFILAGTRDGKLAAVRYTNDGEIDTNFATSGVLRTSLSATRGFQGVSIARGPGRRFTLSGANTFGTARFLEAGANVVTAGTFNQQLAEGGPTRSFIVGRLERLPVATRVFFSLGGTATSPSTPIAARRDYTVANMTVPLTILGGGGPAFVDIPANQTFTTVELNVNNDTRVEGFENAVFTIIPDPSYEASHPTSAEFFIADNDGISLEPTNDAFVRDGGSSDTDFGAATDLQVKRFVNQPGFNRRTYVEFDLTSATTINSAKLRMFGKLSNALERNIPIDVFGTDRAPWDQTTITFNNRPAIVGSSLARANVLDDLQRWVEWDLTSFVQAEKAAGRSKVTFVLNAAIVSNPNASFVSKEGGIFQPELLIS